MINLGLRKRLRQWLLKGNNVYCPCCGKQWFAFLPFGKPIRFNAGCPSCGALERHRLVELFLQNNYKNMLKMGGG